MVKPPMQAVLLAGDEEYRSEEMLPQLAKILEKQGFRCTVLYSLNDKGEIDPENQKNQPGNRGAEDRRRVRDDAPVPAVGRCLYEAFC